MAGDVCRTGLDTTTMLRRIRQDGLEQDQSCAAAIRGLTPGGTCFGNAVDGVHDDVDPEQQVRGGHLVDDDVAGGSDVALNSG